MGEPLQSSVAGAPLTGGQFTAWGAYIYLVRVAMQHPNTARQNFEDGFGFSRTVWPPTLSLLLASDDDEQATAAIYQHTDADGSAVDSSGFRPPPA